MNIDHLGYIIEIRKSHSINRAAKNLFLSQPNLSNILKNLESEVGYKIFQRTTTGISPTEKGETFLKFAENIYNEYNKIKSIENNVFEYENISISASSSSLFSNTFFSYKMKNHKSDIQDLYREEVLEQNLDDLISKRCRMALVYFSETDIERYISFSEKYKLSMNIIKRRLPVKIAASAEHPLAKKGFADVNELAKYPFVTYDGLDFEANLGVVGVERDMDVQYISSRASYYDAIRIGGYISFTMDFAPGEEERVGCKCIPIINENDYYLITYFINSDYTLNEREQGFIAYLKSVVNDMYD